MRPKIVQRVLPRQICRLVLLSVIAVCCNAGRTIKLVSGDHKFW